QTQSASYWTDAFVVEDVDLEFLNNRLLEEETPLATDELVLALVRSRVDREARALRGTAGGTIYLPKESYQPGQKLVFPALGYASGAVTVVRPGSHPQYPDFDVIEVEFGDDKPRREFAARLVDHKLNTLPEQGNLDGGEFKTPEQIAAEYGRAIAAKLEPRLMAAGEVVRLAGAWFPRALLLEVHVGHRNLAEAVLDMAGGGPLPTEELLQHVELPPTAGERLKVFSLNYALQEDQRFDEVGPAGKVLWYLRRLEPPEVLYPPRRLTLNDPAYDRSRLTPELSALARELDDEFQPDDGALQDDDETTLTLTFPHRRVGTLQLTRRVAHLFPTAIESPRVRFALVDGQTGEQLPAWVVREGRYAFGLEEWYARNDVAAGAYVRVRRGQKPGEVILFAAKRRPSREWTRTVVPLEGRLTFGMQKRLIACDYDELMIITLDNPTAVDAVWLRADERKTPFGLLVADVFRELAKLNPQGAVHAKTLYGGVNVIRRCTPEPIFAELVTRPYYSHVGDSYWRFNASRWSDKDLTP
ncbi:MAG: hypothetical protein HY023_02540, partial [Chloroflexi bacterium]|nr:hypothetical protein [Chloroflexota bacterium]